MSLDEQWILVTFCLFIRCSAMLLAAPFTSNSVPPQVRVMTAAVIAFALSPAVAPEFGGVPDTLPALVMLLAREVFTGLLIGTCMHVVTSIAEMAGSFADSQVGFASAQLFDPHMGGSATPLSRFKFMLSLVLIFASDAHHLMIRALIGSYSAPDLTLSSVERLLPHILTLLGQSMLLAVQIAAPFAAVGIIVDLSAGIINKAVPQTQPFLLAMPAKIALGLVGMGLALPVLVSGVSHGVDLAFGVLGRALGG